MTFKIYQIPDDSPYFRDFAFRSLDGLRRSRLGPPLPRDAYRLVYVWRTPGSPSLDDVFCRFNFGGMLGVDGGPPADYTGRSISVGDIVETEDGRLHFCDAYGWAPVSWAQAQDSAERGQTPRSEAPETESAAEAPLGGNE